MDPKPRHRLAVDAALAAGNTVTLRGNAAHYLATVLRLKPGDCVALFNRTEGEWSAILHETGKREVTLEVQQNLRPAGAALNLTVCFAPIKGGRLETIIEKATELGASVLQPVLTQRTIVDRVNRERAESIAREAAEQCERTDWPDIREPLKFAQFISSWPAAMPLVYGNETGGGIPVIDLKQDAAPAGGWGILIGPEGGFTADERATLARLKSAIGVGLGPRILRADTAVITLCTATAMAWGDWTRRPRFTGE